ncbi:hypothetical protein L1887_22532 [Cichorium endivia]|nr:hypothetical protein L1887_22532 [Cichorium endivia]
MRHHLDPIPCHLHPAAITSAAAMNEKTKNILLSLGLESFVILTRKIFGINCDLRCAAAPLPFSFLCIRDDVVQLCGKVAITSPKLIKTREASPLFLLPCQLD